MSILAGTFPPSVPCNSKAKELAAANYLMQTGIPIISGSKFAQSDGLLTNMPFLSTVIYAATRVRWTDWPYLLCGHQDYRQSLVASRGFLIR